MRQSIKWVATAAVMASAVSGAYAIPADPTPKVFTQPDGSSITLSHVGDEYFHCYLTPDGKPVRKDAAGFFRYLGADGRTLGEIVGRGESPAVTYPELRAKVMARSPRVAYRQRLGADMLERLNPLAMESEFDNADGHDIRNVPTKGDRKVLVILAEYSDRGFLTDDPRTAFDNMLNQENYSFNGATGSARDYFMRSSFGQYRPHFDVYGPVKLSKNMAYYGANDNDDNDMRPGEMVEEACRRLDGDINFKDYDTSGDGQVDNVYLFYPQQGEATGGPAESIWPHAWELTECGINLTLDGVKISRYAMSDEINNKGALNGIGTFCHEFAHVLGLPDIYDTQYGKHTLDPGSMTIEAKGSYNNEGRTPPVFSAYERYALEWLKPLDLPAEGVVEMLPSVDYPVAYKIPTDIPTDYFLIENRQALAWDAYTPASGMLVWHIDYDKRIWDYNIVNTDPARQRIDIIEADPLASSSSYPRYTFPGSAEVFSLSSEHTAPPTLRNFAGYDTNVSLTDIHVTPDGVLSFQVKSKGTGEFGRPAAPEVYVESISGDSFTINWTPEEGLTYYAALVNQYSYRGDNLESCAPDDYLGVKIGNSGTYTFRGLEPSYGYRLSVRASDDKGEISEPWSMIIPGADNDTSAPLLRGVMNTPRADDESTVLSWATLSSGKYALTVAGSMEEKATGEVVNDFTVLKPSGWRLSSAASDTELYGAASPGLRFKNTGASCTTPVFENPVLRLSLWGVHSGKGLAMLDVTGMDRERNIIFTQTVGGFTPEGATVGLDIPDGVYCVKLTYRHTGDLLTIDDLKITLGTRDYAPLEGYDAKELTVNEISLDGLEDGKDYFAFVTPQGHARSNVIRFKGTGPSSVDRLPASGAAGLECRVEGGVLSVSGTDAPYSVYTPAGVCLGSGLTAPVRLPARGLYIVRAGSNSLKVAY